MNQNSELETSVTSGISEEIQQRVRVFQEKDQISSLKGHPIGLGVVGDCLVQAIEASGIETDKVTPCSIKSNSMPFKQPTAGRFTLPPA